MKTKLLLPALLTFSFLLSPFAFRLAEGQVPEGFNYQAVATYLGSPVTTAITVRITIQELETGGETFWIEDHTGVVPTDDGVFSIVIGTKAPVAGSTALTFANIEWNVSSKYLRTDIYYEDDWYYMGTSKLQSVPYSMVAKTLGGPVDKLGVKGVTANMEEALFEVKNKDGQTVFAVYNEGVRIYVDDGDAKGTKGGFAIGGFDVEEKGLVPGPELMVVEPSQIRMYINKELPAKGSKGGFAIGGFGEAKGYPTQTYMKITNDSTKFFINDDPAGKGPKGGFAIGGFDEAKGDVKNFFNVESPLALPNTIDPSENRILFHPLKNAFLVGRVKIASVNDVGENSFVSGYESKASGLYSQALGYKNIASGDNSTSMGSQNTATGYSSFAIGSNSQADGTASAAIGEYCTASGGSSMAIGYMAVASGPTSFASGSHCNATSSNTTAFGWGSTASGVASTAIGSASVASGDNSFAFGDDTRAIKNNSFAFGQGARANGLSSYAFGHGVIAGSETNSDCFAFGKLSEATGSGSYAFGDGAVSSGLHSYAFGSFGQDDSTFPLGTNTMATGNNSFAAGQGAVASGTNAISLGYCTRADGLLSIAMGYGSISNGSRSSIAFGEYCESAGVSSIAMGYMSSAQGRSSLSAGNTAISSGDEAVSLGLNTTASGAQSFATGSGTQSTHYGSAAFGENTVAGASFATALGRGSIAQSFASLVIGRYNIASGSDSWVDNEPAFVIGNGTWDGARSNALTILKNGKIGIGNDAPTSALHVQSFIDGYLLHFRNGNNSPTGKGIALFAGQDGVDSGAELISFFSPDQTELGKIIQSGSGEVSYISTSDARMKENIEATVFTVRDLMNVKVRDFNFINDNRKTRLTGFIAQELYSVYPDAVSKPVLESDNWGVDYGKLTPMIVKAVQDQQVMIEELKEENEQLKVQNAEIRTRLEKIESLLAKTSDN